MDNLDPSESNESVSPVVVAVKKYMSLLQAGTAPTPEVFCLSYPEITQELLPCLAGLVLVEQGFGKASSKVDATQHAQIPSDETQIPSALGDFRIVREIGRGGMGVVYEALQLSLGRRVALKVLSFASGLDPVRLQRFRNEAQLAAQLHHSHIVPVYAVGSDRGVHYFAMQLIEGRTLAQVLDLMRESKSAPKTPLEPFPAADSPTRDAFAFDSTKSMSSRVGREKRFRGVAKMMVQAASGLAHAHLYGVVHRDVKPANLILDPIGNVWVTDFGLAQIQSEANLTRSGDLLGTLRYMSPEQASGGKTAMDHRTDIYSLGVTFYELLTLQPAVTGVGYQEIVHQIADLEPISPRSIEPSIPFELEVIMRKAIAKNPGERYETASQMAEDLQRWLDDKPILAKPPTMLQRLAKWRRRHSSLVAVATLFLIFAAIGLFASTLIILAEQQKTSLALLNEKRQRAMAETSFQSARRAVDTFSELGETELSNRPEMKSLRREFLEASLDFYQGFVELRGDDASLQDELTLTKRKIESAVQSLMMIDRLEPLRLLAYRSVQNEIGISTQEMEAFQTFLEREQTVGGDLATNAASPEQNQEWLTQAEVLSQRLSDLQWKRLRELQRQVRLPFTFKSIEVAQALELTQAQKKEISLIIEQERPDRMLDDSGKPGGRPGGSKGPPPRDPRGGGQRRSRVFEFTLFTSKTPKTVERIIAILTPSQQAKWQELIGNPFGFEGF